MAVATTASPVTSALLSSVSATEEHVILTTSSPVLTTTTATSTPVPNSSVVSQSSDQPLTVSSSSTGVTLQTVRLTSLPASEVETRTIVTATSEPSVLPPKYLVQSAATSVLSTIPQHTVQLHGPRTIQVQNLSDAIGICGDNVAAAANSHTVTASTATLPHGFVCYFLPTILQC